MLFSLATADPSLLLVGFGSGLAMVAPVGPVSLTLFGLGAERGRRAAVAGAGGVVVADAMVVPFALGGAGFLGGLDAGVVRWLEIVMGLVLLGLAVVIVRHAEQARATVAGIDRPVRTMAAMTLCNPLSLVAWLGLALALPGDMRVPVTLAVFGVGLVLASAVWHVGIAIASGTWASRMGDRARTAVARVSGVVLSGIAALLVF